MDVKISIIIPIYNVDKEKLSNCLKSVLDQTYSNLEIIMVDDGSAVSCANFCDNYSQLDSRVSVIHQANQGLAGARYSGLKRATGEYVMFLDGDDYLSVDTCKRVFDVVKRDKVDVVVFGCTLDYQQTQIRKKIGLSSKLYIREEIQYLEQKVLDFNANISSTVAKLIRREILVNHQEFAHTEIRQGAEDLVFSLLLFYFARDAYILDEYLYYYVYNPSSITHTYDDRNHQMVINCFKFMHQFLLDTDQRKLEPQLYLRFLYAVVAVGVSGYFSPSNQQAYFLKKRGFRKFLNDEFVKQAFEKGPKKSLSSSRKVLLYCAQLGWFFPFLIAGKIRTKQLKSR